MNKIQRYQPNNSFSKTPAASQIAAYLIFTLDLLVFSTCIIPNLQSVSAKIGITALFMLSFAAVMFSGFVTSCTDSSDRLLSSNQGGSLMKSIAQNVCLYCQKCKSLVQQKSRHCKLCNTCIEEFDHHCIWLNTCVGRNNYISFMVLVVSISVNLAVYLAGLGVLWREGRWEGYLGSMVAVWSVGVVVGVIEVMVVVLLGFHVFLISKGLTTIDYLILGASRRVAPQIDDGKQKGSNMAKNNTFASFENDPNNLNLQVVVDRSNENSFEGGEQLVKGQVESGRKSKLQQSHQKIQRAVESERNTEGEPQLRRSRSSLYVFGGLEIEFPDLKRPGQKIGGSKMQVKSTQQFQQGREVKYQTFVARQQ